MMSQQLWPDERTQRLFTLADTWARRLKQDAIATEHLLLALVEEPGKTVEEVLAHFQVDSKEVHRAVLFISHPGESTVIDELGYTPRVKKIVEYAADEAHRLDASFIHREHMLYGMVKEGEGIAAGVLATQGLDSAHELHIYLESLRSSAQAPDQV